MTKLIGSPKMPYDELSAIYFYLSCTLCIYYIHDTKLPPFITFADQKINVPRIRYFVVVGSSTEKNAGLGLQSYIK